MTPIEGLDGLREFDPRKCDMQGGWEGTTQSRKLYLDYLQKSKGYLHI